MQYVKLAALALVGISGCASSAWATRPLPQPGNPCQGGLVGQTTSVQGASVMAGTLDTHIGNSVAGFNVPSGGSAVSASSPTMNMAAPSACGQAPRVDYLNGDDSSNGQTVQQPGQAAKVNSVWTAGSITRVKKTDAGGEYSGSIKNGVVGYDYRLTPKLVAGLALGYENLSIDTQYNNGTVDADSGTVAPYVGYAITDWLVADMVLGYTKTRYHFTRSGETIKGDTDAQRWFGSINLNAQQRYGDVVLRGGLGYLRLREDQDGYTETNGSQVSNTSLNFGQLRSTVGAGYNIETSWGSITPNSFVRFEFDLPKSHSVTLSNTSVSTTDRTGAVFGLGVDMQVGNDLTLNLSGSSTQFRQNTDAFTFAGGLRYSF